MDFVASLITLVGAVGKTSKFLYDLHSKIQDAPNDITELLDRLQTFQGLLTEVKVQLQDYEGTIAPQDTLKAMWGNKIVRMQQDIQRLENLIARVRPLLSRNKWSEKAMLSARKLLDEKKITKYQRLIEDHCDTLNIIQAMANQYECPIFHHQSEESNTDFQKVEQASEYLRVSLILPTRLEPVSSRYIPR